MRTKRIKLIGLALIVGLIMPGLIGTNVLAQTPIVKQVPVQKVRIVEEVVKLADNFIVLFDASGSMQELYKDTGTKKIALAEKIFTDRATQLPGLDWNAGLYLYTPWKSFYEMQPFNKEKFAAAISDMERYQPSISYKNQPTPLGNAIKNLDPILAKASGTTAVFVFSDGQFTLSQPKIWPVAAAKEIAAKYKDVCFHIVSSAQTPAGEKLVNDLASVNDCSRVASFDSVLSRSEYTVAALYMVRDKAIVETELISKVVGVELDNILFDFNKSDIRPGYKDRLDALAKFLEKTPEAYVVIEGFSDGTGDPKYNLDLSRRRAESVKNFLMQTEIFSAGEANISAIAEKRLVTVWYGKELPVASNDTEEGRQLNRRVRLTVRGL
jgi:OOP family OmpA-OmpF porin